MIILSIGTDEKILEAGGRVYNRQKEYSNNFEKYFCFVFTKNKNLTKVVDNNFIVVPVTGANKFSQVKNLFKLVKTEIQNFPNQKLVVSSQDAFEVGLISYFISRFARTSFLVQVHTDISSANFRKESYRNYFQYKLSTFVLKRADEIRVVSKRMKKYLVDILDVREENIFVLPIYVEKEKFIFDRTKDKTSDILFLGRLEPVKNIPLAIEAINFLNRNLNYNLKLKIVGSGSEEKNLKQKYSGDQYSFITWQSWSNNPEQEFHSAKVSVFPSFYDGWGMSAVESVMCGTPVVMTDVGCAHDFVQDSINGFVCESYKVEDFAHTIERALKFNFDEAKMKESINQLMDKDEYLKQMQNFLKIYE